MVARRSKKAANRVKDLPAKSLSSRRAKGVKGGYIIDWAQSRTDAGAGLLLPAVQKVRE